VTAGTAQTNNNSFEAVYRGGIDSDNGEVQNLALFNCVAKDEVINRTRAVFVHGWRMRDAEKIHFSETSFKRLYWSGYQGKFSAVTWPTGWFRKSAHVYPVLGDLYAFFRPVFKNRQNYDNSESVARRVGPDLAEWLSLKRSETDELYVIAHSMGNVVVSEALNHSTTSIMDGYGPTNAATAAGSYNSLATSRNMEEEWRTYNTDSTLDSSFDMPPDLYRLSGLFGNGELSHGRTSDIVTNRLVNGGDYHYYQGISSRAGNRIVNLYSAADIALDGWEYNQAFKPDKIITGENRWVYLNANICPEIDTINLQTDFYRTQCYDAFNNTWVPENIVTSRFFTWNSEGAGRELFWNDPVDKTDILAHIIPARTKALGQGATGGEVRNSYSLGFTASNQDHSAVFHGYFGDSIKNREAYWGSVLSQVFRLRDYSRLPPDE
jgi:hypothetical protein